MISEKSKPKNQSKQKSRIIKKADFDRMLTSSYKSIVDKANFIFKTNIRHTGTIVEDFIKNLFTQMFGSRFRVTSGYIINSDENGENFRVSPEVDLIIVDTLVPNILVPGIGMIEKAHGSDFLAKNTRVYKG